MCNFGTLLKYEYKKIAKRKLVWITFTVLMLASVAMALSAGLSTSVSEGTFWEKVKQEHKDGTALSGRNIDDALLARYGSSEERIPNGIAYFLAILQEDKDIGAITETELYEARTARIRQEWKNNYLTQGEETYLTGQEAKVQVPVVYQYCEGLKKVFSSVYVIGIMQVMFAAVCIPIIMSDEHSTRMDQLNLSSRLGKSPLMAAKLTAGITVTAAVTVLLLAAVAIPLFYIYGMEGFTAQIQLVYPQCPYPFTLGQVLVCMIGLSLLIAVLQAVAALFLTERLRSGVGAMAVMMGVLLLTLLIGMPEQHRILAQIWNCIPSNITSGRAFLDCRLVPAFGTYFMQWQAAAGAYVVLIILGCWGTYRTYHKYQISS